MIKECVDLLRGQGLFRHSDSNLQIIVVACMRGGNAELLKRAENVLLVRSAAGKARYWCRVYAFRISTLLTFFRFTH